MRSVSLVIISLCFFFNSNAQNQEPYLQIIEGTDLSFRMESISGGSFQMGSNCGDSDEKPVHKVTLDPFWMSTYEVTWDLFEPFLYKDFEIANSKGEIPKHVDAVARPTKPYLDMTFGMGKEGHPALAMTHYNAIQFCKWLYARTGVFYRLPTEAEWEYAAKAGTTTIYHFGNDSAKLSDYAWYLQNSGGKSHQVGEKLANPWGLYDIYGNVAEWTYDQYEDDFYSKSEILNPFAKPEKLYPHVIRGGSFEDSPELLRSSARQASDPSWKQMDPQIPKSNWWFPEAPFVGFRIVRPSIQPSSEYINNYYNTAPITDY